LDWLIIVVVARTRFYGSNQCEYAQHDHAVFGSIWLATALGILTALDHPTILQLGSAAKRSPQQFNQTVSMSSTSFAKRLAQSFNQMAQLRESFQHWRTNEELESRVAQHQNSVKNSQLQQEIVVKPQKPR